ncbi:MAG: hypothetical protein RR543_03670 [Erysipelotrichales bacterium]
MKKVVKKSSMKRKRNFKGNLILIGVFVLYLVSSTMLKNYNSQLNVQLNEQESQNAVLIEQNQAKKLKIDDLKSLDRISALSAKKGFKNQEGNITNVK